MKQPLHVLLGASVALPLALYAGHVAAAQPEAGHYVYVPAGAVALIVPQATAAPVDFPVARMFAQQDAMMQRMMTDMDTLMAMPMPDPQQMIRSVMNGVPQVAPGSGVVVTSISTGRGTCSQTITYGYPGNGGQPVVKVVSSGDACGAIQPSGPIGVTQTLPTPRPVAPPPVAPRPHERLWTIGYPPQPIATGTPPRS